MSHFVHLSGSYMAMWLASRLQLEAWQKDPEWDAERNGYHDNPVREAAAHNLYNMRVGCTLLCSVSTHLKVMAQGQACAKQLGGCSAQHVWCISPLPICLE